MLLVSGFAKRFLHVIWHLRSIIFALFALVVIGAVAIAYVEKLSFGDALYFSFVTGLTIGYGDIAMKIIPGRCVALLIGFIGGLFTGLVIAAAVEVVRKIYHNKCGRLGKEVPITIFWLRWPSLPRNIGSREGGET